MNGFAVVDLETTGIHVGYHHRVVEVAVVHLDADLQMERTWCTLVDPQRDIGESDAIHGLTATLLAGAPTFKEIAGDLIELLAGRRIVAHNARFDTAFLLAEFERIGFDLGRFEAACTLALASKAGLPTRLQVACARCGIPHEEAHSALSDATATAQLFSHLVRQFEVTSIRWLHEIPPFRPPIRLEPSGRTCSRAEASAPRRNDAFVATLARRLEHLPTGAVDAPEGAALSYAELLDRTLEDRVLTEAEMNELALTAESWGLGLSQVQEIHRSYLTSLVALALSDGVLSESEQRDLERVCDLLGTDRSVLRGLIEAATPAARRYANTLGASATATADDLRGKSVCFTGACRCTINGQPITRSEAELYAVAAGMVVAANVTKRLDVLVVADPETQSGKAQKARRYGTRIVAERAFWSAIGVKVD